MQNKVSMGARYLLGVLFLVFGFMGLFNLISPPPDLPENMKTFMAGLAASGYFFTLLKLTETLGGLLLILGVAPALVLVILAPISINIFCVHFFMTPGLQNLVMPVAILTLHLLASLNYWHLYKPLFQREKSARRS